MKTKRMVLFLLAALTAFQLAGCGKKEVVENTAPQNTTAQTEKIKQVNSGNVQTRLDSYTLTNEEISMYYECSYTGASLTAKNDVKSLKDRAAVNAEKLELTYSDTQAFDIFAYSEAVNAAEIGCSQKANSYNYPSDGLQQFILWREQYEADMGLSASNIDIKSELPIPTQPLEQQVSDSEAQSSSSLENCQTDPRLSDNSGIIIDKVYGPDTPMGDEKDFSNLPYGFKS